MHCPVVSNGTPGFAQEQLCCSDSTSTAAQPSRNLLRSWQAAHLLTPVRIGEAVHLGQHDPQMLKQVWHCLARFGNCNPR